MRLFNAQKIKGLRFQNEKTLSEDELFLLRGRRKSIKDHIHSKSIIFLSYKDQQSFKR